jgi:hypothetical protein
MNSLYPFTISLENQFGRPVAGIYSVLLVQSAVGEPADTGTIPGSPILSGAFEDVTGTVPVIFPVSTDGNGSVDCYVPQGVVTFQAWGAPLPLPYVQEDILIGSFSSKQLSIKWRRAWQSGYTYQPNDAVSYGGESFIAIAQSINIAPTLDSTYWEVLALGSIGPGWAKGNVASRGVPGVQG